MKREYPGAPILAVGVIVLAGDRVVLIRRDKEPSRGLWTFPGGAVELGETVREAARREAREETGLEVEVGEVAAVVDHVLRDESGAVRYHYVILDFFARPLGGTLRPSSDVSDVRWASLADVETLPMTDKAQEIARQLLSRPACGEGERSR
jgi:8-oxo-dGTP diphosphatase